MATIVKEDADKKKIRAEKRANFKGMSREEQFVAVGESACKKAREAE